MRALLIRTACALLLGLSARPAAAQQIHLVVVTGVEADADDGALFHKLASQLIQAVQKESLPAANVVYLADKPQREPVTTAGRSTRENVEKTLTDLAGRVQAGDELAVVLIGHGSFDGQRATFNLPGPDLTAADYARLLDRFHDQRIVFVNTASSSGAFVEPLHGPGRTIVAATRTGGERNDTRFPEYFVEAFLNDAADRNRDGRVSIAEAFDYAKTKVAQAYQQHGLILTEHATLDDGSEGAAATLFLTPDRAEASADAAITDPQTKALVAERQALEGQIAALKLRKASMDPAEYDKQLEQLLTALALKTRQIQERKQ